MADPERTSPRTARKCAELSRIIVKQEIKARIKQVSSIMKKPEELRTAEEKEILNQSPDIVSAAEKRAKTRQLAKDRQQEVEDDEQTMVNKCEMLVEAIKNCKHLVVFTGAGISTAASIPDYRGPNGVWTLMEQGIQIEAQDLSEAEPTFTHMAITSLYREGYVKYLVSQNCDGLHLRSGFPRHLMSEVHGNMFIETCNSCSPQREYIRLFDVTEKTGVRRHKTGRCCHKCGEELRDTIVHFGEKGSLKSPHNWEEAAEAVDKTDAILCFGSSLKVLKKYPCLWSSHKSAASRPKLYIINLQWTPKDESSALKINGKCDEILQIVMGKLGLIVPPYQREKDALFRMYTDLSEEELSTTSKTILVPPAIIIPNPEDVILENEENTLKRKHKKSKLEKPKRKNSERLTAPQLPSHLLGMDCVSDTQRYAEQISSAHSANIMSLPHLPVGHSIPAPMLVTSEGQMVIPPQANHFNHLLYGQAGSFIGANSLQSASLGVRPASKFMVLKNLLDAPPGGSCPLQQTVVPSGEAHLQQSVGPNSESQHAKANVTNEFDKLTADVYQELLPKWPHIGNSVLSPDKQTPLIQNLMHAASVPQPSGSAVMTSHAQMLAQGQMLPLAGSPLWWPSQIGMNHLNLMQALQRPRMAFMPPGLDAPKVSQAQSRAGPTQPPPTDHTYSTLGKQENKVNSGLHGLLDIYAKMDYSEDSNAINIIRPAPCEEIEQKTSAAPVLAALAPSSASMFKAPWCTSLESLPSKEAKVFDNCDIKPGTSCTYSVCPSYTSGQTATVTTTTCDIASETPSSGNHVVIATTQGNKTAAEEKNPRLSETVSTITSTISSISQSGEKSTNVKVTDGSVTMETNSGCQISDTSPKPTSVPGWFGKGYNLKKLKKKRLK